MAAINRELDSISITVIYKRKEFKRKFSLIKFIFISSRFYINTRMFNLYQQFIWVELDTINNRLVRLLEHIIESSIRLKEKIEFDINQNILLSILYVSVLTMNSKLSYLYGTIEELLNKLKNTINSEE